MTEKEKEIQGFMKRHNLTREEAEKLWLEDNGYLVNEEVERLVEKSKELRRYEKSDKPRKKSTRERKVDNDKKFLLELCEKGLADNVEIVARKTETEISFTYKSEQYTLKLTKHRPKK